MDKERFKTWIKIGGLIVLIAIAILYRYDKKAVVAPTTVQTHTEEQGALKFEGVVEENENLLPVDGNASLKVRLANNNLVTVTYAWSGLNSDGSTPACKNGAATSAGNEIKAHTRVEIYAKNTRTDTYSTCEDEQYYIHTLNN